MCTAMVSAGLKMFQGFVGEAKFMEAKFSRAGAEPEVKIRAAASPKTRPAEMTMPVTMAGMAAGIRILVVVSQRVRPMAREASRWLRGTSSRACWMVRTRMGMLNIVRARAPERIDTWKLSTMTKKREPNMPTTMEGRELRVSMAVFATEVTQLSGAYSTRKMAAPREMGTEKSRVQKSM